MRVLIVEPDRASRFVLERAVARRGHEAAVFVGHDIATVPRDAGQFELAFVDVDLPGGNGRDVVSAIRRGRPSVPVVLMVAPSRFAACDSEAIGDGVETLLKPFSIEQVDDVIDEIAARRPASDVGRERTAGARVLGETLEEALDAAVAREIERWGDKLPSDLYEVVVRALERSLLSRILGRARGNQLAASALLGLNRNTLRKKLRYLGLLRKGLKKGLEKGVDNGTKR